MMENFKQEFKTYCETVENTKALETIKQYIFNIALNLETFIDDNISNIDFNNNKEIIKEARRLSKILDYYSSIAESVEEVKVRDIWKIVSAYSDNAIIELLNDALCECYEDIVYKYDVKIFHDENLTDEQWGKEKWYTDLCNILNKYEV